MLKIYAPFRNQLWIPKIGLKWWPVFTSRVDSVVFQIFFNIELTI